MSAGWTVYQDTEDGSIHLLPKDDLIGHELENWSECVCQPVPREDPEGNTYVLHTSLDGRELEQIPSEPTILRINIGAKLVTAIILAFDAAVLAGATLLVRKAWKRVTR